MNIGMSTKEIKDLAFRWYKTYNPDKSENKELLFFCSTMMNDWALESLDALMHWGLENPVPTYKTYKDDYFERYPDAPRSIAGDGYPKVSVTDVYSVEHSKNPSGSFFSWYQMWDAKYGTHKAKESE